MIYYDSRKYYVSKNKNYSIRLIEDRKEDKDGRSKASKISCK